MVNVSHVSCNPVMISWPVDMPLPLWVLISCFIFFYWRVR